MLKLNKISVFLGAMGLSLGAMAQSSTNRIYGVDDNSSCNAPPAQLGCSSGVNTISWLNCSAIVNEAGPHGSRTTNLVNNTAPGYEGAIYSFCENGTWTQYGGGSCSQSTAPSPPTPSCSVNSFEFRNYLVCNQQDADYVFSLYESVGAPVYRGSVDYVINSYGSAFPGGSRCPDLPGFVYWMNYEGNHGTVNLQQYLPGELAAVYSQVPATMNGYCNDYASKNGLTGTFRWRSYITCDCAG